MKVGAQDIDQRSDQRRAANAPLSYFLFNSGRAPSIDATAVNCSRQGVCLNSARPLNPGQYICMHAKPSGVELGRGRREVGLKSVSLAEVRWCRENDPAGKSRGYTIGLKYL